MGAAAIAGMVPDLKLVDNKYVSNTTCMTRGSVGVLIICSN
jgi:hypothetical protein